MVSHVSSVKVRWSEADPAGIVFYPRFFEWFDLATEALFDALGLPWPELFPKNRVCARPWKRRPLAHERER
jgi:4-hydroxybenzoyl-CoA thioesterase